MSDMTESPTRRLPWVTRFDFDWREYAFHFSLTASQTVSTPDGSRVVQAATYDQATLLAHKLRGILEEMTIDEMVELAKTDWRRLKERTCNRFARATNKWWQNLSGADIVTSKELVQRSTPLHIDIIPSSYRVKPPKGAKPISMFVHIDGLRNHEYTELRMLPFAWANRNGSVHVGTDGCAVSSTGGADTAFNLVDVYMMADRDKMLALDRAMTRTMHALAGTSPTSAAQKAFVGPLPASALRQFSKDMVRIVLGGETTLYGTEKGVSAPAPGLVPLTRAGKALPNPEPSSYRIDPAAVSRAPEDSVRRSIFDRYIASPSDSITPPIISLAEAPSLTFGHIGLQRTFHLRIRGSVTLRTTAEASELSCKMPSEDYLQRAGSLAIRDVNRMIEVNGSTGALISEWLTGTERLELEATLLSHLATLFHADATEEDLVPPSGKSVCISVICRMPINLASQPKVRITWKFESTDTEPTPLCVGTLLKYN